MHTPGGLFLRHCFENAPVTLSATFQPQKSFLELYSEETHIATSPPASYPEERQPRDNLDDKSNVFYINQD